MLEGMDASDEQESEDASPVGIVSTVFDRLAGRSRTKVDACDEEDRDRGHHLPHLTLKLTLNEQGPYGPLFVEAERS